MIRPEASRRAAEARRLLDEPLLIEALEEIERETVEELMRLPFWSARKQRMLIERIRVARGIRAHLRSVIMAGTDAERKRPSVA